MTGRKTRRCAVIGGPVVALLAMGLALLLAPAAVATPEGDAAAAITAKWEASGGDGGPLGPRSGEVYPAGAGFGQDFAGGKIFFTPATGAHFMQGAILEKYESLGGAGESDLGFPTIDEGPGLAPGSRNSTFSAADRPVIFWTPDTGARVVRGAINQAWDKLGGSTGPLGVPADDEVFRGDVVSQKFTRGELSYNMREDTFTTVPPELAGQLADLEVPDDPASAINAARRAAGGPLGPLGAAQGQPYPIGRDGLGQNFEGGKIFYTPDTGAHVVTGQVLEKYESVGGPEGDLGFPVSSESAAGPASNTRMTRFAAEDNPVIVWTPDYGAVIVRGAMNAAWSELGGVTGELGAPMADQTEDGDVITQRFGEGSISWDRATNTFSTEPANLASNLAGVEVPGVQAPEEPSNAQAPESEGSSWFEWSWWWLLGIVPVLVLAGIVAFATMRNRSGPDDDPFAGDEFGFGGDAPPAYTRAGAPERVATGDDYSAATFAESYAHEGLGPMSTSPPRPRDVAPEGASPWGAPEALDTLRDEEDAAEQEKDEDPDAVDTTPNPVPTAATVGTMAEEDDPLTDTGRHALNEADEPAPPRPAFRLPLDDPHEAPEGYPIKADTKTGLYFVPGSALYEVAHAEIWFASEEFARTNGFVPAE